VISVLVANPKRPGSRAAERFSRYIDGMTISEALGAGIRWDDIRWDAERNYVAISGDLPRQKSHSRVVSTQTDLSHLSAGEELWLWRRQQVSPSKTMGPGGSSMNRIEAATQLGITVQRYSDAERDRLAERDIRMITKELTIPKRLSQADVLALARRRSGMTLERVCSRLKTTRQAYLKREMAGDPRVRTFWERTGFVFP